jgi:hypothetical protein
VPAQSLETDSAGPAAVLEQMDERVQQKSEVTINGPLIIKDERLSPLKLARVIDLHPGPDGITRVVTIRTAEGTRKSIPSTVHNVNHNYSYHN